MPIRQKRGGTSTSGTLPPPARPGEVFASRLRPDDDVPWGAWWPWALQRSSGTADVGPPHGVVGKWPDPGQPGVTNKGMSMFHMLKEHFSLMLTSIATVALGEPRSPNSYQGSSPGYVCRAQPSSWHCLRANAGWADGTACAASSSPAASASPHAGSRSLHAVSCSPHAASSLYAGSGSPYGGASWADDPCCRAGL